MHLTLYYHLYDRWADKLDSLSATATQDPEGFLGHPVNAFKLMKRLNTEWGDLESLVLSDTTDGTDNLTKTQSQGLLKDTYSSRESCIFLLVYSNTVLLIHTYIYFISIF